MAANGSPAVSSASARIDFAGSPRPTLGVEWEFALVDADSRDLSNEAAAVIADIGALRTLPQRELAAGVAEIIKTGAIADDAFFAWIEANVAALNGCESQALAQAVKRSCEIKAAVVAADEREGGLRAILNFGHTFGHAIEAGLGYGEWLHGEAVGCGMAMAADLSVRLGYLDEASRRRLVDVIVAAHLPVRGPALGGPRYVELMRVDKKAEAGEIKFILLKRFGETLIGPAPDAAVLATLAAMA